MSITLESDSIHDIKVHSNGIKRELDEIENLLKKLNRIHVKIKDRLYRIFDSNECVRFILEIEDENEEEEKTQEEKLNRIRELIN